MCCSRKRRWRQLRSSDGVVARLTRLSLERGCIACSLFALALPRFMMPAGCFFWEPSFCKVFFFFFPFPFQLLCSNRSESRMYTERHKRAKLTFNARDPNFFFLLRRFWVFGLSDGLLVFVLVFPGPTCKHPRLFFFFVKQCPTVINSSYPRKCVSVNTSTRQNFDALINPHQTNTPQF